MDNRKGINFFFALIAIITGWTLIKHVDFENFRLADPVLDILYLIVFVISVFLLIREYKQPSDK